MTLAIFLVASPFAIFGVADYADSSDGSPILRRAVAVLEDGHRLHFAAHMAAGRVLDVCDCTRDAAAVQYWRASYHARTERQRALLVETRPTDLAGRINNLFVLGFDGLNCDVSIAGRLLR